MKTEQSVLVKMLEANKIFQSFPNFRSEDVFLKHVIDCFQKKELLSDHRRTTSSRLKQSSESRSKSLQMLVMHLIFVGSKCTLFAFFFLSLCTSVFM
jgi:hypothetical protein